MTSYNASARPRSRSGIHDLLAALIISTDEIIATMASVAAQLKLLNAKAVGQDSGSIPGYRTLRCEYQRRGTVDQYIQRRSCS